MFTDLHRSDAEKEKIGATFLKRIFKPVYLAMEFLRSWTDARPVV
jgi:hypothetical protein